MTRRILIALVAIACLVLPAMKVVTAVDTMERPAVVERDAPAGDSGDQAASNDIPSTALHPADPPNAYGVVVAHSFVNDLSPALRTLQPRTAGPTDRESIHQEADRGELLPPDTRTGATDTVVQRSPTGTLPDGSVVPRTAPTVLTAFDGMKYSVSCCIPPDTNGAVGPHQYVQVVNSALEVFKKDGTPVLGPLNIDDLWTGSPGNPCLLHNDGDPVVLYDHLADRWLISQFTAEAPYDECIAVSTTGDPAGTYYRYAFQISATSLPDYPKLSVWPDGYYMSANMYAGGTNYTGPQPFVFDRAAMLTGQSATMQQPATPFNYNSDPILPVDLGGGALPPNSSPAYFEQTSGTVALRTYTFSTDWSAAHASTFTQTGSTSIAGWNSASCSGSPRATDCVTQPGPSGVQKLDAVGSRLMFRAVYKNYGGYQSIVLSHTVNAAASGFQAGVRWYELRNPSAANPTLYQQGTYAPDTTTNRWMGSIDADRQGDIAIGYSAASATLSPELRIAGRAVGDPTGQLTTGETTIPGTACPGEACNQSGFDRWGDYSSMTVDPTDNCTFWYTSEYTNAAAAGNWITRIAAFRFPSCTESAGSLTLSGSGQATAGSAYAVTVTVKDADGSDVDTAYNGQVTLTDGNTVLAGPYTFTPADSGSHTFSVKFAAGGSRTLTVTDTVNSSLTASENVNVGGAPSSLALNAPNSGTTGVNHPVAFSVTVNGSGYAGTLHFTSNDPNAVLPADFSYAPNTPATQSFQAVFNTPGSKTIGVTDTGNAALSAGSGPITVNAISTFAAPATAGGSDANTCMSSTSPCLTVGAALAKASPGGSVRIAAGTYPERIEISQNLAVVGAGADVTALNGSGLVGSVVTIDPGVTASLSGLTVENGTSPANAGGILNNGTLTVNRAVITGNSATDDSIAGGILNEGGDTLTLLNSTVSNNRTLCGSSCSGVGGGLYNGGTSVIANTTFSGNSTTSGSSGGAIRQRNGQMVLKNVTIANNSAGGPGGGIVIAAGAGNTTTLTNTIITGNSGSPGPDCSGSFISGGHNLIGNGSGCSGAANGVNGDQVNPPAPGANLGALGNNGGPTPTMALQAGSTAIDHGDNTACADPATVNNVDQRGGVRPQNSTCDIGAYEYGASIGATASLVARFTVTRLHVTGSHGRLLFRWTVASNAGIAAFNLHAGGRRLNVFPIPVHAGHSYRYLTNWRGSGPFTLRVVLTTGRQQAVHTG